MSGKELCAGGSEPPGLESTGLVPVSVQGKAGSVMAKLEQHIMLSFVSVLDWDFMLAYRGCQW